MPLPSYTFPNGGSIHTSAHGSIYGPYGPHSVTYYGVHPRPSHSVTY